MSDHVGICAARLGHRPLAGCANFQNVGMESAQISHEASGNSYCGRYLIRGGDVRRLEGNLPLKRVVVLEFPTVEAAQQFYDSSEYQPILNLRLASTQSDVVLVQGYSG